MADERIIIEIIGKNNATGGGGDSGDSGDGDTSKPKNPNDELAAELKKVFHPLADKKNGFFAKHEWAKAIYDQAKSTITTAFNVEINRYFSLNEAYLAETDYNNFKKVLNFSSQVFGSVASGTIAGAEIGGVWGSAIGAAIGLGASLFTSSISTAGQLSNYYQSLNATVAQTNFSASRASLINNSEGTEN